MTDHTFQLTTTDLRATNGSRVSVRALVCSGLAIHHNSHASVNVTHVGSGKAILVGRRFDYVLKVMPELLAVCDWTGRTEDIFNNKAAHDLCLALQRGDEWDDFSEAAILSDDRP